MSSISSSFPSGVLSSAGPLPSTLSSASVSHHHLDAPAERRVGYYGGLCGLKPWPAACQRRTVLQELLCSLQQFLLLAFLSAPFLFLFLLALLSLLVLVLLQRLLVICIVSRPSCSVQCRLKRWITRHIVFKGTF